MLSLLLVNFLNGEGVAVIKSVVMNSSWEVDVMDSPVAVATAVTLTPGVNSYNIEDVSVKISNRNKVGIPKKDLDGVRLYDLNSMGVFSDYTEEDGSIVVFRIRAYNEGSTVIKTISYYFAAKGYIGNLLSLAEPPSK
ncbi:MAG: hypothetical protein ACSHYF_17955 [Verrucomicrobiaceae bacterium]